MQKTKIKIIYTGGTIGMVKSNKGQYVPFDLQSLLNHIPRINDLNIDLSLYSFDNPIDSSKITPLHWIKIVELIEEDYNNFDAFLILHGTDTMAYTSSALGFMMPGLNKPVIITGSQLPISEIRSDARDNIITALQFAKDNFIKEVAVLFDNQLLRGVRTRKRSTEDFNAFESPNFNALGNAGVHLNYSMPDELPKHELTFLKEINPSIGVISFYPGLSISSIDAIISVSNLIILETFGSGTVPFSENDEIFNLIQSEVNKGKLFFAISQCEKGQLKIGQYEASNVLNKLGILNGGNITREAAITKCMVGLGLFGDNEELANYLCKNQVGEI